MMNGYVIGMQWVLGGAVSWCGVKRCRDGNVCEAYVIPFLFGLFFKVYHPYIDVHFLKCFFCDLFRLFFGGVICLS